MLEIFIKELLHASLVGSLGIIVIVFLQKTLFKRYTHAFCYYIWLAVVIRMIVPFKIPIYLSQEVYKFFVYFFDVKPITDNTNWLNYNMVVKSSVNVVSVNSNNTINYFEILFYLWLIVSIIFAVYYIVSYISFNKKIKNFMYDIPDNNIDGIYSNLLIEMNIRKKISLKFCRGISTPLGIGIIHFYILLPEVNYNAEEIKYILKHELMHFKRHDMIYKIILLVVTIIHWFNPLAYILCRLINNNCELSCDEAILKKSDIKERKLYALTLINSLRLNKNNAFQNNLTMGFNSKKNILRGRLENMLNLKKRKKGVTIGALAVILTISSVISVNAFAKNSSSSVDRTNTSINKTVKTNTQNNVRIVYSGKTKDMPQKYKNMFNIKDSTEDNTKSIVITGFKEYTYSNAPESAKKQYEEACKKLNIKPDPSHVIFAHEK
ncbi:M56 family metallopeptidase [Clostridium tyrobutyricum]|uniref:M56 family metallopeptidase n=1 Tax=Clostridium tyrobutyricum TaxID=1519 RepID=UPI001C382EB0|nr:M56 family metallopeptidase [Clostridium tyrobutyricum]MBV4425148.1 M56 family metallopeptidase [Clostridium tyrobutyricum]